MTPPPDDPPPDDPELVAYLDGELDDDDTRSVEARLALDAATRARAEQYKKTFDLLDYLPKPEPSPNFASRTLTRLQPVLAGPSGPAPRLSASAPALPAPRRSPWPEAVLWVLALVAVGAAGYFGHALVRPPNPPPEAEKFDQADLPLIHDLPLYLGVDDLDFLRRLREGEVFDDDPPPPAAAPGVLPAEDRETVTLAEQQKLIALFLDYPPARREQLRTLHRALRELPAKERAPLRRTLEAYAVWLDRLPDPLRKEILAAPNGAERFDAVLRVRERQWRESLPAATQKSLRTVASVEERAQLLREIRERERTFRREWEFAHKQWQPNKSDEGRPWPFGNPALARALDDHVRKAFGVDPAQPVDKKGDVSAPCRLTREELVDLRYRHEAAHKEGYWFSYGACLLQLSELHPMLPEPGKGKPVTQMDQPPLTVPTVRKLAKNDGANLLQRFRGTLGRWPDFALEIHKLDAASKDKLPPLGPCKPGEFQEDVEAFLKDQLFPKLGKAERDKLDAQQGKWPEYPRAMIDLAKAKNLSVPGAMLPGEPKLWNDYYRIAAGKK